MKANQDTLNINSREHNDCFNDETTFYLDDKWSISAEDIQGQDQQYFLIYDNDMVVVYGGFRSLVVHLYYLVNPEDEKDIHLVLAVDNSYVEETVYPIKRDVFKLIKEHSEVKR